jgi:hypothetical protein
VKYRRAIIATAIAMAMLSAIGLTARRIYEPAMCKIYG